MVALAFSIHPDIAKTTTQILTYVAAVALLVCKWRYLLRPAWLVGICFQMKAGHARVRIILG